jgi:hypothetical protein
MAVNISLLIGFGFGLLGAIAAFIIVYDEYRRHKLGGWRLWKEALSSGVVALIFFVTLSVLFTYLISSISHK